MCSHLYQYSGWDICDVAEEVMDRLKGRAVRVLHVAVRLKAISTIFVRTDESVKNQSTRAHMMLHDESSSFLSKGIALFFLTNMPIVAESLVQVPCQRSAWNEVSMPRHLVEELTFKSGRGFIRNTVTEPNASVHVLVLLYIPQVISWQLRNLAVAVVDAPRHFVA